MPSVVEPPKFEKVEQVHFEPGYWNNVYVVGDVHGCFDEMKKLLRKLDVSDDELVVFVGDLIRKGPDSPKVIETVKSNDNFVSVRGNNEEKVIRGKASVDDETDTEYISTMPAVVSWGSSVAVHGGIDPSLPPEQHRLSTLQSMRSVDGGGYDGELWFENYDGDYRVFFGHTVLRSPVETDSAVGLDTGCVYGGELTAYDTGESRFVSVPAESEYRSRRDDKVVSTSDI
ncbi:MAG: metallophosphoesterase family protein [Halobacteria archaeon]|nr:metallophosphoesterase family protein [Halobacteria archaeon]